MNNLERKRHDDYQDGVDVASPVESERLDIRKPVSTRPDQSGVATVCSIFDNVAGMRYLHGYPITDKGERLMVNDLQVLQGIRELLSDETRWTKHSAAKDENGDICNIYGDEAVCFCLGGAVCRIIFELAADDNRVNALYKDCSALLCFVAKRYGFDHCVAYNDDFNTTHGEVLRLLDETIEIVQNR